MTTSRCALAVAAVFGVCGPAVGQPGTELRDQFLRDAPARWQELPGTLPPCYATEFVETERRTEAGKPPKERRTQFTQRASHRRHLLILDQQDRGEYTGTLTAVNDRYAFFLTRDAERGPWALSKLGLKPPKDETAEISGRPLRLGWRGVYSWLRLSPTAYLPDMVGHPTFAVTAATPDPSNESIVRVDFRCVVSVKGQSGSQYSGRLEFDRTRYWALTRYDLTMSNPDRQAQGYAQTTGAVEYQHHLRRLPVPTTIKEHFRSYRPSEPTAWLEVRVDKTERFEEGTCGSEAEFSLPAFGLPEPEGVPRARNPLYWWLIGVGAAVFLAGLFIVRRKTFRSGPAIPT